MLYNASAGPHGAVAAAGGPPVAQTVGQELALNILHQQQPRGIPQPAFPGATSNSDSAPPEPLEPPPPSEYPTAQTSHILQARTLPGSRICKEAISVDLTTALRDTTFRNSNPVPVQYEFSVTATLTCPAQHTRLQQACA
jgi:hypothetical protein